MFHYRPRPRTRMPYGQAILLILCLFVILFVTTIFYMPETDRGGLRGNQTKDSQWPAM